MLLTNVYCICTIDKPEILMTENESKTASNVGALAKLHCRAMGAPTIRFSWEHDEMNITSVPEKYKVEERQVSVIDYFYYCS